MIFEAGLLLEEATQLEASWAATSSPFFPINRLKGAVLRTPEPPGYVFQLFWVKKIVSVKKIQAEVLP